MQGIPIDRAQLVPPTKLRIYTLDSLAEQKSIDLSRTAFDMQVDPDSNVMTTIQVQKKPKTDILDYYLHKHDVENPSQSTAKRIPTIITPRDEGYFEDSQLHYVPVSEAVYMVSTYIKKVNDKRQIIRKKMQSLVHVPMNENMPPQSLEFEGKIHQYIVSADGQWVYIDVEKIITTARSSASDGTRYIILVDVKKWRIVNDIPLGSDIIWQTLTLFQGNTILLMQYVEVKTGQGTLLERQVQMFNYGLYTFKFTIQINNSVTRLWSVLRRPPILQFDEHQKYLVMGPINDRYYRLRISLSPNWSEATFTDLALKSFPYVPLSAGEPFIMLPGDRLLSASGMVCHTQSFTEHD